ncbi:MAG: carbohydrate ABC transporter permease [Spirochaetaceae bacterium]|jgi:raffinose/stachyose/melibiose transport system permease protein|nr:carbohydrate ABC transporter permease [Spirochaetaceae bacterium]
MEKERTNPVRKRPVRRENLTGHYLFLGLFSLLILAPFTWTVFNSLKSRDQFIQEPGAFPNPVLFRNYANAFKSVNFPNLFKNSFFFSSVSVLGALAVTALAAYVLARYRFRINKFVYTYFLMGMMIPLNAAIIPLFLGLRNMGLTNTYQGVIIPYITFQIPMGVFLLTNYMKLIPMEFEESALMDGCSALRLFARIIMPLSRPILATFAIISFMGLWNEFLFALVFLTGEKFYTIPLGLATFRGQYDTNTTVMLAGTVISIVPTLVIYIALRNNIIKGLTSGAIKG